MSWQHVIDSSLRICYIAPETVLLAAHHRHFDPYPPTTKAKVAVKDLTLLHSERPKLYTILAFLSAIGLYPLRNRYTVFYQKRGLDNEMLSQRVVKPQQDSFVIGARQQL